MNLKPRLQVTQPTDPSYRYIPLTQGQVAIVDTDDYWRLIRFFWCAWWNPTAKSFYAVRNTRVDGNKTTIYMHREIMKAKQGEEVDHVNRELTLDNRKKNLRFATHAQNTQNSGKHSDNRSGYKGVTLGKGKNKWIAQIQANRYHIYLGEFPTKELAYAAYCAAARELHGEFVCLV
jgi:AP2 domain